MDRKITRKDARRMYGRIYQAGYCQLQHAGIHQRERVGYNCGVYGWNWDLIQVPGAPHVAICTGYRGMIGDDLPRDVSERLAELAHEYYRLHNERPEGWPDLARDVSRRASETLTKWALSLDA